jgi:hypothetical protein
MALSNPKPHISKLADGSNNPLIGEQQATIAELTDSTTGTAGDTVDDTTASVKDDIASLAAKINAILQVLAAHGLIADA